MAHLLSTRSVRTTLIVAFVVVVTIALFHWGTGPRDGGGDTPAAMVVPAGFVAEYGDTWHLTHRGHGTISLPTGASTPVAVVDSELLLPDGPYHSIQERIFLTPDFQWVLASRLKCLDAPDDPCPRNADLYWAVHPTPWLAGGSLFFSSGTAGCVSDCGPDTTGLTWERKGSGWSFRTDAALFERPFGWTRPSITSTEGSGLFDGVTPFPLELRFSAWGHAYDLTLTRFETGLSLDRCPDATATPMLPPAIETTRNRPQEKSTRYTDFPFTEAWDALTDDQRQGAWLVEASASIARPPVVTAADRPLVWQQAWHMTLDRDGSGATGFELTKTTDAVTGRSSINVTPVMPGRDLAAFTGGDHTTALDVAVAYAASRTGAFPFALAIVPDASSGTAGRWILGVLFTGTEDEALSGGVSSDSFAFDLATGRPMGLTGPAWAADNAVGAKWVACTTSAT